MDKKKWAEMTRQDKLLAIRQCIEGGYGWEPVTTKTDLLGNIQVGYDNDPDWFKFSAEDNDWSEIFKIYAGLLSGMLNLETEDERDAAYKAIMACHASEIQYDENDIRTQAREWVCNTMLNTLNDAISSMDGDTWNRSSQKEREELARPYCESLYQQYKGKVSKETWKYFTEEFLVRENWHTFARMLDTMI
jgi:hypothetical protein